MSEPFTLDDLREIEARYEASSASSRSYGPNPWQVTTDMDDGFLVASLGTDGEDGKEYFVTTRGVHASELRGGAKADGEFIANMSGDLRRLGRAYVMLYSENLRLRERLGEFPEPDGQEGT